MANDLIRYDLRVQDALRSVIHKVLADSARDGLQGEHFFQITFRTDATGVRLSTEMRNRFPDEMTIILQHQFRELSVTEHALEVVLFFNHVPERLLIPFSAISGFFDPSVQFGLRFDVQDGSAPQAAIPVASVPNANPSTDAVSSPASKSSTKSKTMSAADRLATNIANRGSKADKGEELPADGDSDGKIISIDAFRRKP